MCDVADRLKALRERTPNLITGLAGKEDVALEHDLAAKGELEIRHPDGRVFWVRFCGTDLIVTLITEARKEAHHV